MQRLSKIIGLLFIAALLGSAASPALAAGPDTVGLPGTHQDELGCPGEWQPDCALTYLAYDVEDDVWQAAFMIEPGNDDDKKGPRYKVALNNSWSENYGVNATPGGADIPLIVPEPMRVKFYYDHKTHWIADSFNKKIIVATGDFQTQLGCAANEDPGCLRSWLQDPDGDGIYAFSSAALKAGTYTVSLKLNEDDAQVLAEAQQFTVAAEGDEIYFSYNETENKVTISAQGAPKGSLAAQQAIWINRDTILWNLAGAQDYTVTLVHAPQAGLELTAAGVNNGDILPLTFKPGGPTDDILAGNPQLKDYAVFKLDAAAAERVPDILKGQVAVFAANAKGRMVDATGVQLWGVLDALYQYDGPLGTSFEGGLPTLRVWAPTAQVVRLHLFEDALSASADILPMTLDPASGVWQAVGQPDWEGKYYLYEVQVFAPTTGRLETNLVTDPYSLSLSTNSQRSQIIDLHADPQLKPEGWDSLVKPALDAPEDIVIYELHIRDFSIYDPSVPAELRGTYQAFTVDGSNGMNHLEQLAGSGLTHVHLLPAFDIASVNEDKSTWQSADEAALSQLPPDSDAQAKAVGAIAGSDGFNWGYDPLHYTTPEGAYATDPQGAARVVEFRQMVQALNQAGLRVVMDVVYNHTNASGQNANSVLDRIVPGYYHRLSAEGRVEKSTCCENTASEHRMMRKLMIDSVVTWAREYKVDGFRFDLMGHHMLEDMQAVRAALDELTLEQDGVDGQAIYIYGEGWDFGEVAKNARGVNATQLNIGGTGIGVFNDRLRDAVRGGNPFGDPREQGFSTGLFLYPNKGEHRTQPAQQARLLEYTEWIQLGLAGNLSAYPLARGQGETITGDQVLYNGVPAGYTQDPQENIVYVSAHDNETLFDAIQLKAPKEVPLADRIRMNNLAVSTVMFSQGIPFFHAGDDILRSKSLNRNSYNSGDWFNRLDWTYSTNNWGAGLPPEGTDRWNLYRPLLADPALKPEQGDIVQAAAVFREFLQIRRDSPLFRLRTAEQVQTALSFLNHGPEQVLDLIVMRLADPENLDPHYGEIVVFFNASADAVSFRDPSFDGGDYLLHPIQQNSADAVVRQAAFDGQAFSIPGRTTAVFVLADAPTPTPPPPPTPGTPPAAGGGAAMQVMGILAVIALVTGLLVFFTRRHRQE